MIATRAPSLSTLGPLVILAAGFLGCSGPDSIPETEPRDPVYRGSASCAGCHVYETELWTGSHHDLAMQTVGDSTVLGDFDDAIFEHEGVTSRFFKDGESFRIETEGPGGKVGVFEVGYVFGIDPLQQYLIDMGSGRYQVFSVCWDTRPAGDGGQRWFHLYPDEGLVPGDLRHWTGYLQTWNHMCAGCHSTALAKNYDSATGVYQTSWAEIDVGCEACHGPGSTHIAWAESGADSSQVDMGLTYDISGGRILDWNPDPESGTFRPAEAPRSERELNVCAPCHSRREDLGFAAELGDPLEENYRLALLQDNLYYPDGQIEDEVFVHGSFLQSRMYHNGVTCSDCHDPHSNKVHADGNALCARCHEPRKFDVVEHHHHPAGSTGTECVACHMPERTYMVVDSRRDHRIAIPRPDLTVAFGTPNACSPCHAKEGDAWLAETFETLWGEHPDDPILVALKQGREGAVGAASQLEQLVADPEISRLARATAVELLSEFPNPRTIEVLRSAMADESPLIRMAAARGSGVVPIESRIGILMPLLGDSIRTVRMAARISLAGAEAELLPQQAEAARSVEMELFESWEANADRPEALLNQGAYQASQGDLVSAETSCRAALAIAPGLEAAWINLADVQRLRGFEDQAEVTLRSLIARDPESGTGHHALGLLLVRRQDHASAISHLGQAVEIDPTNTRFGFVYAVALHDTGSPEEAIVELERLHRARPGDVQVLSVLVAYCSQAGQSEKANQYGSRLLEVRNL